MIISGVQAIILTANHFILGAFAIIFGAKTNLNGVAFFYIRWLVFHAQFFFRSQFAHDLWFVYARRIHARKRHARGEGTLSIWFGANILLLGANNLLLGAQGFRSFSILFGAFAKWYSLSQYIWSSKLLQRTCSHEICEISSQSPPFRLVTWSASGSGTRMAISPVSDTHQSQNGHY